MYPGDARAKWPASTLTDSRVTHYWDEARTLGVSYLANLTAMLDRRAPGTLSPIAEVMWDAFYLYDRHDVWNESMPMPTLWGYPIMTTHDDLERTWQRLVVPSPLAFVRRATASPAPH
jgi:hypothetical protein